MPTEMRLLYTTMRPHPALSPLPISSDPATLAQQHQHENVYRQLLAQGILTLLLPTDDLRNDCLRSMMTEVLGDIILGDFVSSKLCDAVFLFDMVRRIAESSSKTRKPWAIDRQINVAKANRLEHFGLLAQESTTTRHIQFDDLLQTIVTIGLLAFAWLRHGLNFFIWTTGLPKRRSGPASNIEEHNKSHYLESGESQREALNSSTEFLRTSPVMEYQLWRLLGNLVDLASRMPWLVGVAALLKHQFLYGPGRTGSIDGYFDRYVDSKYFPSCPCDPQSTSSTTRNIGGSEWDKVQNQDVCEAHVTIHRVVVLPTYGITRLPLERLHDTSPTALSNLQLRKRQDSRQWVR